MPMLEHLRILSRMRKADIEHELAKEYSLEQLNLGCDRVETLSFEHDSYLGQPDIQRAIIEQPDFLNRYKELALHGISNALIAEWLKAEASTGCRLTAQPVAQLLDAFAVNFSDIIMAQEYLTYYLSQSLAPDSLESVCDNIRTFHQGSAQNLFNLNDAHRELLLHPFFSCFAASLNTQEAMRHLLSNPALIQFLDNLYADGRRYSFFSSSLEALAKLDEENFVTLRKTIDLLDPIPDLVMRFMDVWQENGAYAEELNTLFTKASPLSADELTTALENQLSYLNLLYSNILDRIPLDTISYPAQRLLIHGIENHQNAFLRMVARHFDVFQQLPNDTVLFESEFYSRLCLNSLSIKDLKTCQTTLLKSGGKAMLAMLKPQIYTFNELNLLSQSNIAYVKFYDMLALDRVDDRLLALRQLLKHDLLSEFLSDHRLSQLAGCISQKHLTRWRDEDFRHITGITLHQCVDLLELHDETCRFWPDLANSSEAAFLIRQSDKLAAYSTWSEVTAHLEEIDDAWRQLKTELDLDAAFEDKYRDHILSFLMEDGASVAKTYAKSMENPESYYRIVRAQLMGEYHTLKYYRNDLDREISYKITEDQKAEWCNHLMIQRNQFTVTEKDDFFTTMRIGVTPQRTCLSYVEGAQRDCLLACFDSNKKILYATLNEKPVARAMIRLTKGCRKAVERKRTTLEFADLRENPSAEKSRTPTDEELVLFLEYPYTNGLNDEDSLKVKRMFIEMVIQKAKRLGAKPVFSQNYINACSDFGMVSMLYNIYISRSKAGVQYLDSMGGANSVSSEDSYKSRSFLMLPE